MVLRADVLARALEAPAVASAPGPLLYLSARGRPLAQARINALAAGGGVKLLCGRYEGVDQRLLEDARAEEVCLGDFVLAGGEVAAMALIEAAVRLLPGVMGNALSAARESFAGEEGGEGGEGRLLLEHPQYTRPALWRGRPVPEVLMSGDHAAIEAWRRGQSLAATERLRPDLLANRRGEGREARGRGKNKARP